MKVAIINPWFISDKSIGGTERFVQDLAVTLAKLGHKVDVYMLSGNSYKKNNVNYISLELFGKNKIADEYMLTKKFGVLDNINTYLNIARILENKVNCAEYDFLQLNSHIFLKCWENKKRIFTLHSNYEEFMVLGTEKEFNLMVSIMQKEACANTYFVTPSYYYYKKWLKLIQRNIFCIPHGLNIERLKCNKTKNELLYKYGLDKNLIKILLPSRLELIQKQPNLVLEALEKLEEEYRNKFQVVFTGLDEQYNENIEFLKKKAHTSNINVKFIQFNKISEGYKICDIVLIPSKSESFGYSALESLYLGIPTLLSKIPSLQEISEGSSTGILFGNTNIELALSLKQIAINKIIKRKEVSEQWIKKYSLDLFAQRYVGIINENR